MLDRDALIDYLKREKPFTGVERELEITTMKNKITSIIGPRRAGKTFYMLYLLNHGFQDALYLNFESMILKNIKPEEFLEVIKICNEVLGYSPKTLLLDEIQEVEQWDVLLRTLLDYGYDIVVTGSSSKLMSKEISTRLRGRSISHLLLPFSFGEFLRARGVKMEKYMTFEETGSVLNFLREYLEYGGYPEIVLSGDTFLKEKLLMSYFDEIFLNDFVERHEIRSIELGRLLFEFIFQNFSKEMSIKNIESFLRERVPLSKKTIYSYLEKVRDTLSVFFVDRFSFSVYLRKTWPKKVYIADVGLAIPISFSPDVGKRMENAVFLELMRRTNHDPLLEIFYFRDYQGREVDFVIKRGSAVNELLQVTYASGRDEIENREIKSLIKASELMKCKNLTVITWDYENREEIKNRKIRFIPLWKWLLEK